MTMRKFRVKVNGKVFDVDVEEVGGSAGSSAAAAPAVSRPGAVPPPSQGTRQAAPAPAAAPAQAPAADGPGWVLCPMAGKIQKIPVKVGEAVKPDTVVAVLEAMKMETSVCAGASGTVLDIAASEGNVVDSGARLVRIA